MQTIVIGIKKMIVTHGRADRMADRHDDRHAGDAAAGRWWSILMQRLFVKGLVETEK